MSLDRRLLPKSPNPNDKNPTNTNQESDQGSHDPEDLRSSRSGLSSGVDIGVLERDGEGGGGGEQAEDHEEDEEGDGAEGGEEGAAASREGGAGGGGDEGGLGGLALAGEGEEGVVVLGLGEGEGGAEAGLFVEGDSGRGGDVECAVWGCGVVKFEEGVCGRRDGVGAGAFA
jgi:hypothetical protein